MRPLGLFWSSFLAIAIPVAAAVIAMAFAATSALEGFALARLSADLTTAARLLEPSALRALERPGAAAAACQEWRESPETYLTLISAEGFVLCEAPALLSPGTDLRERGEVAAALRGQAGQERRHNVLLGREMLFVAWPVRRDGQLLAVVRVGASLGGMAEAAWGIYGAAALLAVVLMGVAALLAQGLARRLRAPLRSMEQAALGFGAGQLDGRVPLSETRELRALGQTLNEMAARLDARMREVQARRNEQEAVFASMMEGVLAVDTGSRVINLNRMAADLFGVDLAGARGRNLLEIVRNPDLRRFVSETLSSRQPAEQEIELHDSQERLLSAHGTMLLDAEGRRMGALVVLNDVTRLRRLEQMRRDFVANVSHELKTPITSIQGFVETLLDGAMDQKETTERFLKIIARQADRLSAIIEDLLQLSRIERESEHKEVPLRPHNLVDVLREAVELCQPQAEERGILIELDCPAGHVIPLNSALLESAVVNLIDNAVKFSDPKSRVRVSIQEGERELIVSVQDWGRGIAPTHLPRLFERFYRVDPSRDRKAGGSGLGLAIVKHIAQAHGGTIDVKSQLGGGSTFFLHLPKGAPAGA